MITTPIHRPLDERIGSILQPSLDGLPVELGIERFIWSHYVDLSDEASLFITAVVPEETTVDQIVQASFQVFEAVQAALLGQGIDLYPYVRLLPQSALDYERGQDDEDPVDGA